MCLTTLAPTNASADFLACEMTCETVPALPYTMPADALPSVLSSCGDEVPDTMRLAAGSLGSPRVPSFESCNYFANAGAPVFRSAALFLTPTRTVGTDTMQTLTCLRNEVSRIFDLRCVKRIELESLTTRGYPESDLAWRRDEYAALGREYDAACKAYRDALLTRHADARPSTWLEPEFRGAQRARCPAPNRSNPHT